MHDTPEHANDPREPENDIVAVAAQAKAAAAAVAAKGKRWPLAKIGLAAGIGSAAISAAVLYASRNGETKK